MLSNEGLKEQKQRPVVKVKKKLEDNKIVAVRSYAHPSFEIT